MARNDERARARLRIAPFQRRHHVRHDGGLRHARRRRLRELVERHREVPAGFFRAAFECCADPAARGADAAFRIVGARQRMARAERGERAHVRLESRGRDVAQELLDVRIYDDGGTARDGRGHRGRNGERERSEVTPAHAPVRDGVAHRTYIALGSRSRGACGAKHTSSVAASSAGRSQP
jgi:hypothetical protein